MRCRLSIFLLVYALAAFGRAAEASAPATEPPVPPILLDALTKLSQDFDRWAYTETRNNTNARGKPVGETIIRFDPSKPYAEQYLPLKINGQAPTERQLREYQKRGEKRGERLEKEEAEGKTPGNEVARFRLAGDNAAIDLAHAVVESETPTAVTYNVPLRKDPRSTLPVEKLELIARINKERHDLENVSLRLKESFRMRLVVNVKAGAAAIDFSVVNPKHASVMTSVTGEGTASVMFVKFGGSFDVKRTDFQRVKPFSEKFGVKIGPMKALDF
jgi:hypothetical protein